MDRGISFADFIEPNDNMGMTALVTEAISDARLRRFKLLDPKSGR